MLATPRHVLTEIKGARRKPWWVNRVFGEVQEILTGMGVIDQPMSAASIEALLEEAVERAMRPATPEELVADFRRLMPEGSA